MTVLLIEKIVCQFRTVKCIPVCAVMQHLCLFLSGNATVILLAQAGEIGIVDVRAADYQKLFSIPGQPSAVAYYLSREAYFWIDERKTLQMFVIGGRNITSLYPGT